MQFLSKSQKNYTASNIYRERLEYGYPRRIIEILRYRDLKRLSKEGRKKNRKTAGDVKAYYEFIITKTI
jgi:hypothetical protein